MYGLGCVPLSYYCEVIGETPEAINKRIQRGIWREGTHVLKIEGVKERWIDPDRGHELGQRTCKTTYR